jgi:hypothetical protein
VSLFEEIGLVPDVFDVEHYEDGQQELALSAFLVRVRSVSLVRAVHSKKWKEEAFGRYRNSVCATKVPQLPVNENRVIFEDCACEEFRSWWDSFGRSHIYRPMRALISDDLAGSDSNFKPPVTNISKVVTEDWWSDLPLNQEVDASPESFVRAIRLPLARTARIDVVDRFLLPSRAASRGLLELMLNEVVLNPRLSALRFHSSLKPVPWEDRPRKKTHGVTNLRRLVIFSQIEADPPES